MVDADEWDWIAEHATGDVDHLLIGTSLPLFMGPALHCLEAWNEAVCDGAWGRRAAKLGEKLRQALDLEHWPAFQDVVPRACASCCATVGAGRRGEAPATIGVLSGDVHHAYLAEVGFPPGAGVRVARSGRRSARRSATRSTRNERRAILAGWTRAAGERIGRVAGARAGVPDPPVRWRLAHEEPWFNNQVAHARARRARRATFVLEKAIPSERGQGHPSLEIADEHVFERPIEANVDFARRLRHALSAGVMIR